MEDILLEYEGSSINKRLFRDEALPTEHTPILIISNEWRLYCWYIFEALFPKMLTSSMTK
jgi:hypothetical protein